MASAGWRKCAGEPVELSVAAIFLAMMPLLPMPVSRMRPRPVVQAATRSTARVKAGCIGPSRRAANAVSAAASMRTSAAGVSGSGDALAMRL